MKPSAMIDALIEIEGLKRVVENGAVGGIDESGTLAKRVPVAYLTDENCIQRIIRGMDNDAAYAYMDSLMLSVAAKDEWAAIVKGDDVATDAVHLKALRAKLVNKCEAVLRAHNKWEDKV